MSALSGSVPSGGGIPCPDLLIGKDSISLISCRVSEQGALRVRSATRLPGWLVSHVGDAAEWSLNPCWALLNPSHGKCPTLDE